MIANVIDVSLYCVIINIIGPNNIMSSLYES